MREHVRSLISSAQQNHQNATTTSRIDLGAQAVRLARIAAAIHVAQSPAPPSPQSSSQLRLQEVKP